MIYIQSQMMTAKLQRSTRAHKKYQVSVFQNNQPVKIIHFGDPEYEDFTQHKDPQRKKNYIQRHKSRESWHDPYTAGFWARWLLWEKPSMEESKHNISKMFNIEFL